MLVEHVAPKLKRRHRAPENTAGLGRVGVPRHTLVREPVAQPLLRQMLSLEVVPHREAPGEEHRRHLRRRLADLRVERFALLHDEDAQSGGLAPEKDRCRGPAEGSAGDHHVVSVLHQEIILGRVVAFAAVHVTPSR